MQLLQTCMLVDIGLTRSECASWVQAWGSIGAICVTGTGVWLADRLQGRRERARLKAARVDRLEVLYELVKATLAGVTHYENMLRKELVHADRVTMVVLDVGELKSLHQFLAPVTLHELDDPEVAFEVLLMTRTARDFGIVAFELSRGIGYARSDIEQSLAHLAQMLAACELCASKVRARIDAVCAASP